MGGVHVQCQLNKYMYIVQQFQKCNIKWSNEVDIIDGGRTCTMYMYMYMYSTCMVFVC